MSAEKSCSPLGYPRLVKSKEVFGCPWFHVHEEIWEEGVEKDQPPFYRIESADGVLVLGLTTKGEIILVRQFRHAVRRVTLEFPAGSVDQEESPEEAAARELFEETGYRSSQLLPLGSGHLMVNRSGAKGHIFLAKDCELDRVASIQGNEEVHVVSPETFKDLVLTGGVEHIPTLSLLILAEWKTGVRLVA